MAVRAKTFVAVRDFSIGRDRFTAGDQVPNPSRALARALRYGDRFVTERREISQMRAAELNELIDDLDLDVDKALNVDPKRSAVQQAIDARRSAELEPTNNESESS